jgi:two-component system OmpR family response regulator
MQSILIVDDDEDIRSLLQRFFVKHGFEADTAASGQAMDVCLRKRSYDLAILDVMLPGEDGFSLCKRLRATSKLAIIMVTGADEATDRIVGLELGADDYVTKPFDARELLARVRAVLRRSALPPADTSGGRPLLRFSGWQLDVTRRELRSSDMTLTPLSGGEFELLVVFAEHPQRILSREQLIDMARGPSHEAFDRSIDVQVSRLRRKIEEDAGSPEIIRTIRNGGYMFTAAVERSR